MSTDAEAGSGHASVTPDAGQPRARDGSLPASCARCAQYASPQQTGMVEPAELSALSGLAASRAQPGIFFAHNDHDRAVAYALNAQGQLHARIELAGAGASDIEDIAVGPCGPDECVYLADIGDNAAQRGEYAILRFVAPTVPSEPSTMVVSTAFERFRFTYEDGSHNAESLMVAPDGTLYIVTKLASGSGGRVAATGVSGVYRLPSTLSTSSASRADEVATLSVPAPGELAVSAAAVHPCGDGFVLRTYDRVYEFVAPPGAAFEAAFRAIPIVVAMPDEPQSEGIDYLADGRGFLTAGEGARAPLFMTTCAQ